MSKNSYALKSNRPQRNLQGKLLIIVILLIIIGIGTLYFVYCEGNPPQITITPQPENISAETEISIAINDKDSGLSSVSVQALQGDKSLELSEKDFKTHHINWTTKIKLAKSGLQDGPFELAVTARDKSWKNWGAGNTAKQKISYTLDTTPPIISVLSSPHNLKKGGSNCITYNLSEDCERTGISLGKYFFPAYKQDTGKYLCFFAFPYSLSVKNHQPEVIAEDLAGNISRSGFYHHINNHSFPRDRINISESFLQSKMPQFKKNFPQLSKPIEIFLHVNRELRQKNRKSLYKIGRQTASVPLWEGSFIRQPNAARQASFGDKRSYYYQGQKVDNQTHLGVDLASIAQAEVPAANSGRVAYNGFMGIYGQVVIIDHGLGLQSLYAHLSQINVREGEAVQKGQIIGNTGATGLAGGDHLHFAILVSGLPVNPVEWWDKTWIKNNIREKIQLAESK
mgnify:CR=1 FL=1